MQSKLIVVDAGHGQSNRRPGVFDPGAVRYSRNGHGPDRIAATEADFALRYTIALDDALRARGFSTLLTRPDSTTSCSLRQRLALAQQTQAALLVSLHLNAAPRRPAGSRSARGHEVLYRTRRSRSFAEAVAGALGQHIPPHGSGIVRRPGLYVLRYYPSVLVEVGFLTSDEDFALLADDLFKVAAMESVAGAIADAFRAEDSSSPCLNRVFLSSNSSEQQSAEAGIPLS